MIRTAIAPAKVNLFLYVGPVRHDGYHPVSSLIVFADVGDRLTLAPAPAWSFACDGLFAGELGPGENLVERAARSLFARASAPPPPVRLTLTKLLPVAAGLGGGSSDAAAALRMLNALLPRPLPWPELVAVASEIGADGPACLAGRTVVATGRGDRLAPAPAMPPLPAVLVNPRTPAPTAAVYRAYDRSGVSSTARTPRLPPRFDTVAAAARALAALRNDLEAPASTLAPAIVEALARVRGQPEALLVRMTGSGATVFALCATGERARDLASRLAVAEPGWWVQPCTLAAITNP